MDEFYIYFELGIWHILDWEGYDHVLFIIALCAPYTWKHWKQVLFLATAFTLGHSLTLGLYALDYISVNPKYIETLIPITILVTAICNLSFKEGSDRTISWSYLLALGFGLIHGLGFANFFKAMMGGSEGLGIPLFSFNVAIEVAQILIIIMLFIVQAGLFGLTKVSLKNWNFTLSALIGVLALKLLIDLVTW